MKKDPQNEDEDSVAFVLFNVTVKKGTKETAWGEALTSAPIVSQVVSQAASRRTATLPMTPPGTLRVVVGCN